MYHGQAFGQICATSAYVPDISRAEAEKIADGGIIDRCASVQVAGAPSLDCDVVAPLDQCHGVRECCFLGLRLDVLFGPSRKGGHQCPDHGGREGQKSGISEVLSSLQRGAKCGFMGNGDQWVNEGKEIIYEQSDGR